MFLTLRGLVVRNVRYKDADSVLTVLTDRLGKITVKARGANRKNSPVASASQLFTCSDMVLFEKQGRYTLNEAQVIEQFEGLREDLSRMALASYFAEVLAECEEGDQSGEELLRPTLNLLYALSSGKYNVTAVKTAFELKYAVISGYSPQLDFCSVCGEEAEAGRANPRTGELCCPKCRGTGVLFSKRALSCARHILFCDVKKLLSFEADAGELRSLSEFSEKYLSACLERGFKTLDFYYKIGDFK